MLLLIDNFDSFTYNLAQAFQKLGQQVEVLRHHAKTAEECIAMHPRWIVIGPGPGNPSSAGISKECIRKAAGKIPLLGVCLGHQAIGEVFGGQTIRSPRVMHGKTSQIFHSEEGIFKGLSQGFLATRYHSLIVEKESFPGALTITAETREGEIMGLAHTHLPIYGVQFHPESIASEQGLDLLQNFLLKK